MRQDQQLVPASNHRATRTYIPARLARAILAISAVASTTGCAAVNQSMAEDADPAVPNDAADFTFANHSSPAEYCGLLDSKRPDIPSELDPTDPESAQVAISAVADISVLAPEEVKADWAELRWLLEEVVDASINQNRVDEGAWAVAQQRFDETSTRLATTIKQLCPGTVWMPEPRTAGSHRELIGFVRLPSVYTMK